MKDPKFFSNNTQSGIEFKTNIGRLRFYLENKNLYLSLNENVYQLSDSDVNLLRPILADSITGNIITDLISESTAGNGVVIDGVRLKDGQVAAIALANHENVGQVIATEVELSDDVIVGSDAGDIGHASGAELIAAPGAGYVLELISAILIYDYSANAYGGGGNDMVIQDGDGAVALTTAIASADLLGASVDKIVHLSPLSASDQALTENKPLTLKSTAFSQPGLPEVFTLQVTVAEDTGGNCTVALDGVDHSIAVAAGTINENAAEIAAYIDALDGYSASASTDTVTVTAASTGTQTDATFAKGTCNSLAATVVVTQQGVDSANGIIRVHISYRVHKTSL